MEERADLTGLTNVLTDFTMNVHERDLESLGVKKGSFYGLKDIDYGKLHKIKSRNNISTCHAGSPGNVIFNASKLGLKTSLCGSVGKDAVGEDYLRKLKQTGIKPYIGVHEGESGVCYVLVTPDGERTNLAKVGIAGKLDFNHNEMNKTNFFHTSGYEMATNPKKTKEVIHHSKQHGAKISFDFADKKIIRYHRKNIGDIMENIDVLFVTEEEATEMIGENPMKSLYELSKICPVVSLKKGARGSVVKNKDEQHHISVVPVKVKNTCGAGDAYASGFLYAHIKGFSLEDCGKWGSFIASRVCGTHESHL